MWYHTKYKFNNNFILAGNICGPFISVWCSTTKQPTTFFAPITVQGICLMRHLDFLWDRNPALRFVQKKCEVFFCDCCTHILNESLLTPRPPLESFWFLFFLLEVGNLFIINKLFSWFLENFANPLKILYNPSLRNAGVNQPPTIYKLLKCMIPTQKGKQKKTYN